MTKREGFTLLELLIVVAIMSLLMAILLPSLGAARESARSAYCLNNLRQFVLAAQNYAADYAERYPIAQYRAASGNKFIMYSWNFTTTIDWDAGGASTIKPGLLWRDATMSEVHQCPSFSGASNTAADPYTGYNYNTSYVGHGQGEVNPSPVRLGAIKRPGSCALFGDGEWRDGSNNFMRSPFKDPDNDGDSFDHRYSGTQGYRHLRKTNVAWADGHAVTWLERHTTSYPNVEANIAEGTGFLSDDNRLYDLK